MTLVETYCTFPVIEKAKLYRRTIFNYLCGNEDMHLKNYSLISRDSKVELSPAYDLLNTSIVLSGDIEESALPIKGKKKKLNRSILVDYLAYERMKLHERSILNIQNEISSTAVSWIDLIDRSFLSTKLKDLYKNLLEKRLLKLGL
ncbi:MAG: HipA domain-containing protein [Bacteroidota bacterium]|nr:HipA domain-containing protein [Bacteroidota bacterium]